MTTVKTILKTKGDEVWSVAPDTPVMTAIEMMAERRVGALAVLEGDTLVGVIAERDYVMKIILDRREADDVKVRDIMTSKVWCAQPDQSVEECMAMMTDKRVRHLPVVEDARLAGMISIGDLVKSIINEQRFVIEQLEHYISS